MPSKQELITVVYEAFNRREIEAVLAAIHEEVDWPNGIEGGRMRGKESVREYWTRHWSVLDPRVDPIHIEEDEAGNMVVQVHQVVKDRAGNTLADKVVQHVYVIRDGLIERMEIREDRSAQT